MKVISIFLLFAINIALALAGTVYKCKVTKTDIKSGPGSGYSYIGWLDKGDFIYATKVSNGWAKFHVGWVNTKDLAKQTSTSYNYEVTADALNFREGPGTNYNRITLLNQGTKIVYYGRDCWNTSWGITNRGYCSMEYVAKIIPTPTPTPGSVILKTTKYNQHDYQYVYDSDCTIDYSGCLITSVAMALNQIEGRKLTPVDAAKMMSFDGYCCATYYGSNRWVNEKGLYTKKALQNLYDSIVNKKKNRNFWISWFCWYAFRSRLWL